MYSQQRRVMSREELRDEVEDRLSRMVPGDSRRGPDLSTIRKASEVLDEIMALVDAYFILR